MYTRSRNLKYDKSRIRINIEDCSINPNEIIETKCTPKNITMVIYNQRPCLQFDYHVNYNTKENITGTVQYERKLYNGLYQHQLLMNETIPFYLYNDKVSCTRIKYSLILLSIIAYLYFQANRLWFQLVYYQWYG